MNDRFRIRMNITYQFLLNIPDDNSKKINRNLIYNIIDTYLKTYVNGSYSFFMDHMISNILIKIYGEYADTDNLTLFIKHFFNEFCQKQVVLCNGLSMDMTDNLLHKNIKSYVYNCIHMKNAIIEYNLEEYNNELYNIIRNNFYNNEIINKEKINKEKMKYSEWLCRYMINICNQCLIESLETDKLKEYFYVIS